MKTETHTITTVNQLVELAKHMLKLNQNDTIYVLIGDLGAGKTTLMQAFGKELGISDPIVSPTYSIINEYESANGVVYHMDLYRLNSVDEAMNIGIEDYLYSGQYVFIEWPEVIKSILPEHQQINIEVLSDSSRKIVHLYNSNTES